MKVPLNPPETVKIFQKIAESEKDTFEALLSCGITDSRGRYLHWDQLRHREPPQKLTSEEWWLGTKMARKRSYKNMDLKGKDKTPFVFTTPDFVLKELHWLDQNTAGSLFADRPINDIINPHLKNTYLIRSLVEEAIKSSQLEGAATTVKVAKEMIRQGRKPQDKSEQMILNNFHAMQFIRECRKDPLTPSMVLELHQILTEKTLDTPDDAGKYRIATDDVHVVDGVGDVLYTPPDAKELPERMERLCDFANSYVSDMFIHPVIKAILLHFALAFDHPFVDGNGRTARALFYWSMSSQGYWLMEFISISRILKQAPAKYGKAFLYTETDENDTTYFIIHQLKVIRKAINELKIFLNKKVQDLKTAEELLKGAENLRAKLNYRQLALLRHAFKSPGFIYKINEHQQSHGVVYQTARNDLLEMSDKFRLLDKVKEGRRFVFISPQNLIERIENAKKQLRNSS